MAQQDSIQQQHTTVGDNPVVATHRQLTPAQVLKWLPRNATPAQQDSAIQAHFKPDTIRWSKRPDTLHLPGHDKGHNMLDVDIPQYYREGFFSKDTLFHPELTGGRYGVAGDPVPDTVNTDNVMTGLLLFCFLLAILAFSSAKGFIVRQYSKFFSPFHDDEGNTSETLVELRFQLFLAILTGLMSSLLYYFYTLRFIGETFVLASQYYLIAIYLGIFIAYFLVKILLYQIVNVVLFDGKRNRQWMKALLFITAIEGVLLFPAVMMQAYFDLSVKTVVIYVVTVLVFVKLLTIFKCFIIFFYRNVVKLQIILYFCALELVPMLALWSILDITANVLKIKF